MKNGWYVITLSPRYYQLAWSTRVPKWKFLESKTNILSGLGILKSILTRSTFVSHFDELSGLRARVDYPGLGFRAEFALRLLLTRLHHSLQKRILCRETNMNHNRSNMDKSNEWNLKTYFTKKVLFSRYSQKNWVFQASYFFPRITSTSYNYLINMIWSHRNYKTDLTEILKGDRLYRHCSG